MYEGIYAYLRPVSSSQDNKYLLSTERVNIIGRAPDCQVVLNAEEFITVSRYHAQIELNSESGWQISDKNSRNGTFVNGEKITSPRPLKKGDIIMLGPKGPEFVFEIEYLNPTVLVELPPEGEKEEKTKETTFPLKQATSASPPTGVERESPEKTSQVTPFSVETPPPSTTTFQATSSTPSEETKESPNRKATTPKVEETKASTIRIKMGDIPEINITTGRSIWNLFSFQELVTLETEMSEIQTVVFGGKSQLIGIVGKTTEVTLWSLANKEKIASFTAHKIGLNALAFSRDGKFLASSGGDKLVKIWDLETGEEIHSLTGHKSTINALAFSPDGAFLASSGADKFIKLWRRETGEEIATFSGHKLVVNSLAFSGDGRFLYSGGGDKFIKVWNLENNTEEKTLKLDAKSAVRNISCDEEKKQVALIFQENKVSIISAETEQEIYGLHFPEDMGSLVAINREGNLLASVLPEGKITVWQLS
ncbi:MAG: FHA domain-containing protein [Geminocystis sp.]|nr:FHA domain-containing protein [Geminocystis sp.]HIK38054.1 FHA domain-containing protein [Geminocystis sp. M7585_C2015_104]MCS7146912.1 FHA domain-containing protein [Geminocystis sp.]MCX8078931.1 FHA domain-containing protein [Geminocystis sp.]MDW8115736.1 FHA domain-containing protein [Geminocystis sp.]